MKAQLFDVKGAKKAQLEMPAVFDTKVREDIAAKLFEVDKFVTRQPYATYDEAGKRHSASGTISHKRHEWKGHYGKGISRTPRKTMYRKGTQFFWIAAEVSHTRGGRAAHPPQGMWRPRKINDKEVQIAMNSALAATVNASFVVNHYSSLSSFAGPAVIESLPVKTKDLMATLKAIYADAFRLTFKIKEVRAGRGKRRGRRFKSNAGLLIVTGNKETANFSGIDIIPASELRIGDVYPLGRLTLYTKAALEEFK
ncbi:MAG: 50S ribosomal protein L4 [archaeon]